MQEDGYQKQDSARSQQSYRPQQQQQQQPGGNKKKPKDFVSAVLSENWKQQSMVKKDTKDSAFAMVMLFYQVMCAAGLTMFAVREGGGYVAPAIAAVGYTAFTVSNSFDRNLHGLIGFLDSPIMVMLLSLLLVFGAMTPASLHGFYGYIVCILPFIGDMLVSMRGAYLGLTGKDGQSGGATVEEIDENQENFIPADESEGPHRENECVDPSERLLPSFIAEVEPLNNLMTSNWKENAVDSQNNSTMKQLIAFALIASYFYLGGSAVATNAMVPLGAITLGYAASSLVGYFGLGSAPVAKFARINMISVICAVLGIGSILNSGMDMTIFILTILHMFDAYQGAIQQNKKAEDTEFQRQGEQQEEVGPIMSFFTQSWKINSFHKKNYSTCQAVQMVLFSGQLYMALIAMISGNSMGLMSVILAMIAAGAYSYFSPKEITAVNALQSNGAQVAVLGAATHNMVMASPTTSFYILFCLLACDTAMSCSTFFQEHQQQMGRSAARTMGLLNKPANNSNSEDFNRQM